MHMLQGAFLCSKHSQTLSKLFQVVTTGMDNKSVQTLRSHLAVASSETPMLASSVSTETYRTASRTDLRHQWKPY